MAYFNLQKRKTIRICLCRLNGPKWKRLKLRLKALGGPLGDLEENDELYKH